MIERYDRYKIGKEQLAGVIFSFVYLGLGFLFGEPKISLVIFAVFAVTLVLARLDIEWPLAIYVRIVHLVFVALIALAKMSVIEI